MMCHENQTSGSNPKTLPEMVTTFASIFPLFLLSFYLFVVGIFDCLGIKSNPSINQALVYTVRIVAYSIDDFYWHHLKLSIFNLAVISIFIFWKIKILPEGWITSLENKVPDNWKGPALLVAIILFLFVNGIVAYLDQKTILFLLIVIFFLASPILLLLEIIFAFFANSTKPESRIARMELFIFTLLLFLSYSAGFVSAKELLKFPMILTSQLDSKNRLLLWQEDEKRYTLDCSTSQITLEFWNHGIGEKPDEVYLGDTRYRDVCDRSIPSNGS